jgi:hypothetical protein
MLEGLVAGAGTVNSASVYPSKHRGDARTGIFVVVTDDDPVDVNKDINISCEGKADDSSGADWGRLHLGNIDEVPLIDGLHGAKDFFQSTGSSKHTFMFVVQLLPVMRTRSINVGSSTAVISTWLCF